MATKLDHALVRELRESTKKTDADLDAIKSIIGYDILRIAGQMRERTDTTESELGRGLTRIARRASAAIDSRAERAERVRADISGDRVNKAALRRIHGLANDSETCRVTLMGLAASLDHVALTAPRKHVSETCATIAGDLKRMSEAAFERIDSDLSAIAAVLDVVES